MRSIREEDIGKSSFDMHTQSAPNNLKNEFSIAAPGPIESSSHNIYFPKHSETLESVRSTRAYKEQVFPVSCGTLSLFFEK